MNWNIVNVYRNYIDIFNVTPERKMMTLGLYQRQSKSSTTVTCLFL